MSVHQGIDAVTQSRALEPKHDLEIGARVLIEDGPLFGLEGELLETRSARVVLSIQLLRTVALIEMDRAWIRPLRHSV